MSSGARNRSENAFSRFRTYRESTQSSREKRRVTLATPTVPSRRGQINGNRNASRPPSLKRWLATCERTVAQGKMWCPGDGRQLTLPDEAHGSQGHLPGHEQRQDLQLGTQGQPDTRPASRRNIRPTRLPQPLEHQAILLHTGRRRDGAWRLSHHLEPRECKDWFDNNQEPEWPECRHVPT